MADDPFTFGEREGTGSTVEPMVDSSSQIDVLTQPIRHLKWLFGCMFCVLTFGCGPKPEEQIRGQWVIDRQATLAADPQIGLLPSKQKKVVTELSTTMFKPVVVIIGNGTCAYQVGESRRDFSCEVTRVDHRDEVSLRMKRRDGRTDFMRARLLEDDRMALLFEGRPLEMRRR